MTAGSTKLILLFDFAMVLTSFRRRPVRLALVKGRLEFAESQPIARVEKWKVFGDECEVRERFGLQDRALAVLDALSFHPDAELNAEPDRKKVGKET